MTDPLDVTNPQPAKHLATTRMADTHGAGQLVVLSGETAGRRVVVEDGILLGRDPEAGLSFEGVSTVSRQHARITRQPSGLWLLEDLGSSNGTSINGSPVERAVLRFGDKIRLGSSTVLLFGRHDPLEDQLFEAQRFQLLGQLAAGIAHDFNNVLGAILTNADHLAAPGDIGAAEAEQCVNDIRAATRQGADLVRQLLSFATPGQKEARAARVSTVTEEVRRLLSRTIQRTVTFESQVPADLTAACTPSVLLQILMNLCVNAVQAMPKGGTIRITSAAVDPSEAGLDLPSADPYTRISVEDNGLGMDAKTKKIIQHIDVGNTPKRNLVLTLQAP